MSGIPLATLLPDFGEVSGDSVQRWVSASLAHAAALRIYDAHLYPRAAERQAAAQRLHDAWRSWVEDAEAVVERAFAMPDRGSNISDLLDLREEIAARRGMLKLTLALITERRAQVERGEVYSMEEVRRELRAGNRG